MTARRLDLDAPLPPSAHRGLALLAHQVRVQTAPQPRSSAGDDRPTSASDAETQHAHTPVYGAAAEAAEAASASGNRLIVVVYRHEHLEAALADAVQEVDGARVFTLAGAEVTRVRTEERHIVRAVPRSCDRAWSARAAVAAAG